MVIMAHVSFKNVSVIYLSVARQHLVVFLPELCVRQIFPRHPRPVSAVQPQPQLLGPLRPCYPGTVRHGHGAALHDINIDNVPQHPGVRSEGAECGICIQAARSHNILMRQMSMFVHFPAAL